MDEATRNKLDRTPEVMQARERANAQVIARAYLQNIISKVSKPSKDEIDEYYVNNPEYFAQRKQFDLVMLRINTRDLNNELKIIISGAKSLNDVKVWLDKNNIQYSHSVVSRSTADFSPEMAAMLQERGKGDVFIINEKENSLLVTIDTIRDSSIITAIAAEQIEKFLINQKYKKAIDTEITRLRSFAKIEYLNDIVPLGNSEKMTVQSTERISESVNNLDISGSTFEESIGSGIIELK
jgi:hypothetical protein